VLRNGEPFHSVVNDGLIGVRIGTAEIPRNEIENILNPR
jgi:hypothetical protein